MIARFPSFKPRFERQHVDREIIALWVRCHLRVKLSFQDVVETMAVRGRAMAHATIMRWGQHDSPPLEGRRITFALGMVAS